METTVKPCVAIDSNGWDTVYAIRYADVNNSIVKKSSSPKTFLSSITGDDGVQRCQGTFSDWQLTTGGDGRNLFMQLPMPTAEFEFLSSTDVMTNISAIVEINLEWLGTGAVQNLTASNSVSSVVLRNVNFGTSTISVARQSLFRNQLEDWLKANIAGFQHSFAQLNIDEVADQGKFAWLKPVGNPSYAIADAGNGKDITKSVFAVLAMTSTNPSPGTHQVSPLAIPDGSNSALLLHPKRVLENMFKPGIHLLFDQARTENFDFENNGLNITNNIELSFGRQILDGGKVVTPKIGAQNFKLKLETCKVVLEFTNMNFEWSSGITVNINHKTEASIGITAAKQLTLNITNSNTDANVTTSTGVLIAEIVGPIVGAIVGGVVAGILGGSLGAVTEEIVEGGLAATANIPLETATGGTTIVVNATEEAIEASIEGMTAAVEGVEAEPTAFSGFFARPIVKLLAAAVAAGSIGSLSTIIVEVLKSVAKDQGKDMPSLDTFGKEALGSITWPNTTPDGFTLNSVDLSSSLQLGIQLQFN
jgi:Clostridium P-47 protein